VIVGQFDKAAVQKSLEELFGNWKTKSPYARILNPYRKVEAINRKIETPDKQNAMLVAGGISKMGDDDADYPAMILADYMLGGPTSSRLFRRIREKEGLSYAVQSAFQVPTKDDGATFMAIAVANPANAPKVEASFNDELAKTLKDGFTADEVSAAKAAWLQERQVQRSQDQALAGVLMSRERFGRTLEFDKALETQVASLTPEQVSAAFRKHIDQAGVSLVKAGDFKKASVYQ